MRLSALLPVRCSASGSWCSLLALPGFVAAKVPQDAWCLVWIKACAVSIFIASVSECVDVGEGVTVLAFGWGSGSPTSQGRVVESFGRTYVSQPSTLRQSPVRILWRRSLACSPPVESTVCLHTAASSCFRACHYPSTSGGAGASIARVSAPAKLHFLFTAIPLLLLLLRPRLLHSTALPSTCLTSDNRRRDANPAVEFRPGRRA